MGEWENQNIWEKVCLEFGLYVCLSFLSKAVVCGFGGSHSVLQTGALLKGSSRWFVLDTRKHTCRGCHCFCFVYWNAAYAGYRFKLLGPSATASCVVKVVFLNKTVMSTCWCTFLTYLDFKLVGFAAFYLCLVRFSVFSCPSLAMSEMLSVLEQNALVNFVSKP